jgi:hypothetical protein
MRPGMPLGRKHFRRSRDAPISEKDFWPSFLSKIVVLKTCIYLSRWQRLFKTLDEGKAQRDSAGNSATPAV